MKRIFVCDNCRQTVTHESDISTGYGIDREGNKVCFQCCGLHDEQEVRALRPGESIQFYFAEGMLTNWPGTFKLTPFRVTEGKHNIGRVRIDAWFRFNHNLYHGLQVGFNHQCMKLTRVKA